VPSFAETAPTVLTDISEAKRFVRGLDQASDLMEAAASSTALATLALDIHLQREGRTTTPRRCWKPPTGSSPK
jgi:hypothetical protein